jgi:hypothetical protein
MFSSIAAFAKRFGITAPPGNVRGVKRVDDIDPPDRAMFTVLTRT